MIYEISAAAYPRMFMPSPQLSTIRAFMAIACADLGRRAIMLNLSRSASTISRGFLGRPVRIPKYEAKASGIYSNVFLAQDTSSECASTKASGCHAGSGDGRTQL